MLIDTFRLTHPVGFVGKSNDDSITFQTVIKEYGRVKPGTDKSVPTIFVIIFVGTVLTVPAQKTLKQN